MKLKVLKNGRHLPYHSKKERRKSNKLKKLHFSVVVKNNTTYTKASFTRFNNKRLLCNAIYTIDGKKYKCIVRNGTNVIFEKIN